MNVLNVAAKQSRTATRDAGWTIFEVLSLILLISAAISAGKLIAKNHGIWLGTAAGILCGCLCMALVSLLYYASSRKYAKRQSELREKYRSIYRVVALPGDTRKVQKPLGAEIQIGDYGWESQPLFDDGLVYLQGLTGKWRVVWYAGFRPEEVEKVGPKPQSQYDWEYSWESAPPPCPFPVQARETRDLGLPAVFGIRSRTLQ